MFSDLAYPSRPKAIRSRDTTGENTEGQVNSLEGVARNLLLKGDRKNTNARPLRSGRVATEARLVLGRAHEGEHGLAVVAGSDASGFWS